MSFEVAAIIVVALGAIALALICYYLLGRLEMLERAVHGGLAPPSTRLSREQFERRFRTAHARSSLAADVTTGLVLVVGAEHTESSDLARTLQHLPRRDLVHIRPVAEIDADALGITTTPFLFIVDDQQVRSAQPIANTSDIVAALEEFA